ncbi:hypothetical protein Z949_1391 [Sulfitobacter guttiformis KCTC 32187]|nr:hypothetical protein Z949_1391 [Sulfitobacter guttiformis KCTC 32187]
MMIRYAESIVGAKGKAHATNDRESEHCGISVLIHGRMLKFSL